MQNNKFVTTRQPTKEETCLALFGKQTKSVAKLVFNNVDMFTDDVDDATFDEWLRQGSWHK